MKLETCTPDRNTVDFLALTGVETVNAEFQEFFAEVIETLCVGAPACMRKAAARLDAATLQRLRIMLEAPVFFENPDVIAKAKCLPEAAPLWHEVRRAAQRGVCPAQLIIHHISASPRAWGRLRRPRRRDTRSGSRREPRRAGGAAIRKEVGVSSR